MNSFYDKLSYIGVFGLLAFFLTSSSFTADAAPCLATVAKALYPPLGVRAFSFSFSGLCCEVFAMVVFVGVGLLFSSGVESSWIDVLFFFIILVSIVPVLLVLYLGNFSGYLGNLSGKLNGKVWLHKNVLCI